MDNSTDNYLHKKFKKQLSIEPRSSQNNDKENKESARVGVTGQSTENQRVDNNSVPNQSTNHHSSSFLQNSNSTKSSISVENWVNSCISYIVSNHQDVPVPASFDTKFNESTKYSVSTSSILDDTYPRHTEESYSESPISYSVQDYSHKENPKLEDTQPAADKSSTSGKYVCSYCNLVCSKPSVLQKHIRAHTNERPYPCKSCGFSFKTRSNLYKHCRSRTHANRVMGNRTQEPCPDGDVSKPVSYNAEPETNQKPYKPRFHTSKDVYDEEKPSIRYPVSEMLTQHINEIIDKNNSIITNESYKKQFEEEPKYLYIVEEPLNLSNKNRKRSMSEVTEPVIQKSLIKELLLKNLSSSDMQCPYCKMIFQTVTELEIHKYRSCKGKPSGAKYTRSSSVNVASILTQNKNAFDNIPQFHNTVFPLNSPGPFLGKTRLVDSDKSKSFSFDGGNLPLANPTESSPNYLLSPLIFDKDRKPGIKLFGGEVRIHSSGETKSFKIDGKEEKFESDTNYIEYGSKISENRVIKSSLQSGGTVLTNKAEIKTSQEVIRVYENTSLSSSIDITSFTKSKSPFDRPLEYEPPKLYSPQPSPPYRYTNIMDFSRKAVQKLTPNIKQPNFHATKSIESNDYPEIDSAIKKPFYPSPSKLYYEPPKTPSSIHNLYNPVNLLVNGKVVRHVPGMPGPVTPEDPIRRPENVVLEKHHPKSIPDVSETKTDFPPRPIEVKPPDAAKLPAENEPRKFSRPNSLALKPTTASLKQHHGLTPTKFNQILISPDTPRVAKKYAEHFLHGNYFSYLGLKSSTKPVYCTLNKTQPFYVPHFKKLSMYSEWRQQDTKQDKLYVSNYDSRQKSQRYTVAGRTTASLIIHSSYKFMVSEVSSSKSEKEDQQKSNTVLGGYECNEDYTYIRGRGRGRYVCDQCGIRCKKPSMLKKHIRTHSNDRPYTCNHCNFSFKTKGNLTKHMKSKAHTKNYTASNSSGSSTQQSTHSSESDTEDSGMDSSDESTRQQEHEAAYSLLSLSQKPTSNSMVHSATDLCSSSNDVFMSSEEIAYVSKTNYAKNKILDEHNFNSKKLSEVTTIITIQEPSDVQNVRNYLGKCSVNRPLTYPYTTVLTPSPKPEQMEAPLENKSIKQFHVVQKYIPQSQVSPKLAENENFPVPENVILNNTKNLSLNSNRLLPILKLNDVVIHNENVVDPRKRKFSALENLHKNKMQRNEEVMDLSMTNSHEKINGLEERVLNNSPRIVIEAQKNVANEIYNTLQKVSPASPQRYDVNEDKEENFNCKSNENNNRIVYFVRPLQTEVGGGGESGREVLPAPNEYDNSAMETLADIATKQVKLEKNMLAKSVASEFLKLATKNENLDACRETGKFATVNKDVNDIIAKSEGNKSCTICSKSFNKPSQLRLHMNIHYLERPFRCDSCSVSFRTKGHLQKHERSAGHHNKLSSSPALSTSEPRPFKCGDCNIAFRIHGHLAKHLRSKMHIMKLECLAKIPFGLYAELERSNSLLTEINTCDGDQCLESLKTLAKKVFINDPNKLNHLEVPDNVSADC